MKTYRSLLILILIASFGFSSLKSFAGEKFSEHLKNETNKYCSHTELLESLPTLSGGRLKPLLSLSQETFQFLTGKTKLGVLTSSVEFCLLSFSFFDENIKKVFLENNLVMATIEHVQTKNFLKMAEGQKTISLFDLLAKKDEIDLEFKSQMENTSYRKDLIKLVRKISLFEELISGSLWSIFSPLKVGGEGLGKQKWKVQDFIPLAILLEQKTAVAFSSDIWFKTLSDAKSDFISGNKEEPFLLELKYLKWHLFDWALLFSLITLMIWGISKNYFYLYSASSIIIIIQIAAITLRVIISGRAPITNMYETVTFSGVGAHLIGLFLSYRLKERKFLLASLIYNFLALMMIRFANNMLDSSIAPLVPVLRDNFWLSTHVTTVILSYAALAVSWILCNIYFFKVIFKKVTDVQEQKKYVTLSYTFVKIGVVLLAAGVILGGIWADYSWGRFWGWDPKETWSLIALLIYMAVLHGRHTQWLNSNRFLVMVSLSFLSIMMAWFGVNYILASGLHSYGFSEGGFYFLMSFFVIQIFIVVIYQIFNHRQNLKSSVA